jgi:CheY-like chemotaxis protein
MPREKRGLADPRDKRVQAVEGKTIARQFPNRPGVLVVDDDHLVRIMVQLGLERKGFEVWSAPNGREAIDLYREHRDDFTVVLLAVCMPNLDGPATLDALRKLNPEVVVCFTTDDTAGYQPEELIRLGAAHVVVKPFLLEDLATILWTLTRGTPAEVVQSWGATQR